jgi:hypothetical protein
MNTVPFWFRIWFVICLVLGITIAVYTFKECGVRALLLGNGGPAAAFMGMCE